MLGNRALENKRVSVFLIECFAITINLNMPCIKLLKGMADNDMEPRNHFIGKEKHISREENDGMGD